MNSSNTAEKTETFAAAEGDAAHDFLSIKLTPPLALTIALMFIIASDGHLDAAESSQIQSVVGQNEDLIRFASQYVRAVPLKAFLARATQGLSSRDKICILSNVYDAMLADGHVHAAEEKIFQLLLATFGVSKKDFLSHAITLQLKNDSSVLGDFKLAPSAGSMTPHLALAASVLYMMTADGNIDKHEIGRLETLVAEFEGLQKLAVTYVKETKRERFIQEAAYALTTEQKEFILLNVYDTMTSDGVIAVTEDKIFAALLAAFEVAASGFSSHLKVLEDKNIKPFDLRKVSVDHLFEMMQEDEERQQVKVGTAASETMGQMVSRTMEDNIANVKQDIGSAANVVQIQGNAVDALNVQIVDAANAPNHREQIDATTDAINRALLQTDNAEGNRGFLQADSVSANRALIATDDATTNRQALFDDAFSTSRKGFPSQHLADNSTGSEVDQLTKKSHGSSVEIRVEHLSDDIQALHEQLTHFENENKRWLNIGKLFQQAEERNEQQIFADDVKPNRSAIAQESIGKNLQTLEADEQGVNRQKINSNGSLKSFNWLPTSTPQSEEALPMGADVDAQASTLSNTDDHGSDVSKRNLQTPTSSFVSAVHLTPSTSKRGDGFIHHQGHVRDWGQRRNPLSLKEFVLALSLMVCVSNLGATKQPTKSKEIRGVLLRHAIAANGQDIKIQVQP